MPDQNALDQWGSEKEKKISPNPTGVPDSLPPFPSGQNKLIRYMVPGEGVNDAAEGSYLEKQYLAKGAKPIPTSTTRQAISYPAPSRVLDETPEQHEQRVQSETEDMHKTLQQGAVIAGGMLAPELIPEEWGIAGGLLARPLATGLASGGVGKLTGMSNEDALKTGLEYGGTEALAGAIPYAAKYLKNGGKGFGKFLSIPDSVREVPLGETKRFPTFSQIQNSTLSPALKDLMQARRRGLDLISKPISAAVGHTLAGAATGAGGAGISELVSGKWDPKRLAEGAGIGAAAGLLLPPLLNAGESYPGFKIAPHSETVMSERQPWSHREETIKVPDSSSSQIIIPNRTPARIRSWGPVERISPKEQAQIGELPYLQRPEVAHGLAVLGRTGISVLNNLPPTPSFGPDTTPGTALDHWKAAKGEKSSANKNALSSWGDSVNSNFIDAITRQEGAKPELNNPGNIEDASGHIRKFNTPEEGIEALKDQIQSMAAGKGHYKPGMTLKEAGLIYSGNDPNWSKNVAKYMGVDENTKISDLVGHE